MKKPDLVEAHQLLDMIRREREDQLMLTGARADRPGSQNSIASQQGLGHGPARSAGLPSPNRQNVSQGSRASHAGSNGTAQATASAPDRAVPRSSVAELPAGGFRVSGPANRLGPLYQQTALSPAGTVASNPPAFPE